MRFGSRTEFCKGDSRAYQFSRINGWLDEWFIRKKPSPTIFTREYCYKLAKKCHSRRELARLSDWACTLSRRNGWMDDYTWFTPKPRELTREVCFETAKRFKTRGEFRYGDSTAYYKALRTGWINDYTWFPPTFIARSNARRKYSDKEVEAVARKYTKMSEFINRDGNVYYIAWKRGLLPKFTWLKRNVEVASRNYTDCVYAYEFKRTKSAYIGRTVAPNIRDAEHRQPGDTVYEYARAHHVKVPPMKIVAEGFYPKEGAKQECRFMDEYSRNGWKLVNRGKGGSLGALGSGTLTKTFCINFARKFEYITDLLNARQSVYNKLRQYGWIKECTWLKYKRAEPGTFTKNVTKEMIAEMASRFKNRSAFARGASAAYHAARENGWLDEVCPLRPHPSLRKTGKFDLNTGKLLATYPSAADAARDNGIDKSSVADVCRGKAKQCRGFVYRYL